MDISTHTAVLDISLFAFPRDVLNRAMAPGVSRHSYFIFILALTSGKDVEMEIDAEGEQQVGVEYLFLSTANEIGCGVR